MSVFRFSNNVDFNNIFDKEYYLEKLNSEFPNYTIEINIKGDNIKISFFTTLNENEIDIFNEIVSAKTLIKYQLVNLPNITYRKPSLFYSDFLNYIINSINFNIIKEIIIPVIPIDLYRISISCKYNYNKINTNMTLRVKFDDVILDLFKSSVSNINSYNCYYYTTYIPISTEKIRTINIAIACEKNTDTTTIKDLNIEFNKLNI